tara:strand:+ start:900 stop:1403 length:504 start_codon:yes stop_codon:yes gene_type:complete
MNKYLIIENNTIQNKVAAEEYPSFLLKSNQIAFKTTDITGSGDIGSIYYSPTDSFIPVLRAPAPSPPQGNYISGSTHIIQNFNSQITSTSAANITITENNIGNIVNFIQNSDSRSIEFDFIPTPSIDSTIETKFSINLNNITNIVNTTLNTEITYIYTGSLEGLNQD